MIVSVHHDVTDTWSEYAERRTYKPIGNYILSPRGRGESTFVHCLAMLVSALAGVNKPDLAKF